MFCNSCGNELPDDAKFCNQCGNAIKKVIENICLNCGNELPDGAVFCNKCGIKVYKGEENEQSASASQAETSPSPLISKAVNIQNEMKKEQPETAYPQPSNVENHAINQQALETAGLQSVVPTTAVSSQQEAVPVQAPAEPNRAAGQIQNNQDEFIGFVENYVKSNTEYDSVYELLNSKPKAKFASLSYGISAAIMLVLSFVSISKGTGIWVIAFMLALSIIPGYLAALISGLVAKTKLMGKYTLKLKGHANPEELKGFLNTRLSYLNPYFADWGYLVIKGYGIRGAAQAGIINAVADAAQETNFTAYYGARKNIMLQIGVKPDLPENPDYTVCTFSADSERIGTNFISSYKSLMQTAPIMQAAMEYYFILKNANVDMNAFSYSSQVDHNSVIQICEAARKKASSGYALALTAVFVAVAIIVACTLGYMIDEKNRRDSYANNGFTANASTGSMNVTNDSKSSYSPSAEKEVTIGGVSYDVQSTRALGIKDKKLSDEDIENIGKLINLKYFSLDSCDINDYTFLTNLTGLTGLSLDHNNIIDVTPLANMTNLTSLILYSDNISDITSLANLTNLTKLNLDYNNISDITPLANLTGLTDLDLDGNNISDISPLENLTGLPNLHLCDNNISDISPLANLTNLTHLYLTSNNISDISPLENLTNLTSLDLSNNNISDISPLANLTNLNFLALQSDNISDISPLANLTNLTCLYLNSDSISDQDLQWLKSKLPNCAIY